VTGCWWESRTDLARLEGFSWLIHFFQNLFEVDRFEPSVVVDRVTVLFDFSVSSPIANRVRRYAEVLGGFRNREVRIELGHLILLLSEITEVQTLPKVENERKQQTFCTGEHKVRV